MPEQRPGKSHQEYRTPEEFLIAARRYVRTTVWAVDLAASAENTVASRFFSEEHNSLIQDWHAAIGNGWGWLNPPFGGIARWVEKAKFESRKGCRIAVLVPASVGSNWWKNHVHNHCTVVFLNGRISFDGKDPFPKDCALLLYPCLDQQLPMYNVWSWMR